MIDTTPAKDPKHAEKHEPVRKPWSTPAVIDRGDVRDVTLGPTVGNGESGNPGVFRP